MFKHPWVIKFCWALMILGTVIWLMIPLVVFLPLEAPAKAAWAGGAFIASEVIFWVGALVIGPSASKRIWSTVRQWLRLRSWESLGKPKES